MAQPSRPQQVQRRVGTQGRLRADQPCDYQGQKVGRNIQAPKKSTKRAFN